MSVKDYRRQLEEEVEAEEAHAAEAEWGASIASVGGMERLDAPRGDGSDAEQLRRLAVDPRASSRERAVALGEAAARSGEDAHVLPLERLADPRENPEVRLKALGVLKLFAIASPTAADWRPQYLAALRAAVAAPELRLSVLEVLSHMHDRATREQLLEGLRDPARALVPVEVALRFLSGDPHGDVRAIARTIVDQPPDEGALDEALKILAGDPDSIDRLKGVLNDPGRPLSARKLAATSLNALGPEHLEEASGGGAAPLSAMPSMGAEDRLRRHVEGLLDSNK